MFIKLILDMLVLYVKILCERFMLPTVVIHFGNRENVIVIVLKLSNINIPVMNALHFIWRINLIVLCVELH